MKYEIISLQPLKIENSSYAEAMTCLIRQEKLKIKFIEFSFFKQILVILRGFERKRLLFRIFTNIYNLVKLLFSKNKTILIAAAPYSIMVFLLNRLKARNRCIFYTSWPFWDGKRYTEKIYLSSQVQAWQNFLNGIIAAGVTHASCEGMAKYGAKTFYTPHSVDTDLFVPRHPKPASDKIRVLYVGKLLKIKGLPLLIDIIKKYHWENIEFQVAGGGPYEKEIVRMERDQYPVKYLGFVRDKRDLVSIYQNADILILPSYQENFGIVLLEAMACNLPVIATDCAGPRELVKNGVNGFMIPRNNEEALKDAILKLASSPEMRNQFGKNGRKKVEETYDVKVAASRLLSLIETVHQT